MRRDLALHLLLILTDLLFLGFQSHVDASSQRDSGRGSIFQQNLLKDLLKGYDKDVHPAPGEHTPVNVIFGAKLSRIIGVDERNNVVKTQWWMKQAWNNPLLRWNKSNYGNISLLHLDPSRVWIPDILLYNNADEKIDAAGGLQKYHTKIGVKHDGSNTWLAPTTFHSICNMDIKYFPFDEQVCFLQFASWAYDITKLDMEVDFNQTGIVDGVYQSNTEWEIPELTEEKNLRNYSCCPHPYADVKITLRLVRRSYHYIVNLVFPCALIACMVFFTFILPAESGERISLCITVLMAMTIFQELTSEKLPPSADNFLLGMYYNATTSAIAIAIALTCIIINLYYRKTKMPSWMKNLLLGRLADILRVERTYPTESNNKHNKVLRNPTVVRDTSVITGESSSVTFRATAYMQEEIESPEVFTDLADNFQMENINQGKLANGGASSARKRKTSSKSSMKSSLKPSCTCTRGVGIREDEEYEMLIWQEEWKTASRVIDRLVLIIGIVLGSGSTAGIFLQAPRVREMFW